MGEVPDLWHFVDGILGNHPGERPPTGNFFSVHIDAAIVSEPARRIVEGGQRRQVRRAEPAEIDNATDVEICG
jgi:hypothetical protein